MNSVCKVDEWKRRCAEPPPVLRKPDLKNWQSEQQRHRECLASGHAATKLCSTTAREERENSDLARALKKGRDFQRNKAQAELRRENARLVQKLADVAHRSMSKQNKLARTPAPPRACTSLNDGYRRRMDDLVNAENAALLRRLESAKPVIVDVKTGEGSFKRHLLHKQRILRYKRDSNNELRPLPGVLRPTTAPERMGDSQRSESKRPYTADDASGGQKRSPRGQSKGKGKGYHLEALENGRPPQNSHPLNHEEQEQLYQGRPDTQQQPRQDRRESRGTPPSSTWEESLLFGQRPQTAAGPKTGLDGVEGDNPELRSNGSSPISPPFAVNPETGYDPEDERKSPALPAQWEEQWRRNELPHVEKAEDNFNDQTEDPLAAPSQDSKPATYSGEFDEQPSMQNATGSEPSAEFEKYSGEDDDDDEEEGTTSKKAAGDYSSEENSPAKPSRESPAQSAKQDPGPARSPFDMLQRPSVGLSSSKPMEEAPVQKKAEDAGLSKSTPTSQKTPTKAPKPEDDEYDDDAADASYDDGDFEDETHGFDDDEFEAASSEDDVEAF